MFTRKDKKLFSLAGLSALAGFILMLLDPVENGFGPMTLWIAPPLLLAAFSLPVFSLIGVEHISLRPSKANMVRDAGGFLAFVFPWFVYLLTLEPTASLWDCSEFIACAYKLQVPHTPGTPLSLLLGRVFSMLAFGDETAVARTLNFMSAVFSALAVYLVYRIIFYLGETLINDVAAAKPLLTFSALAGALCVAFSDTFWFSAVEAETYGPASFFLLLIFWLIITGKHLADPMRSRRLILIFYLAGLGYCIHPMCLLALPVLPFAWFINRGRLTFKNTLLATLTGLAIVFLINRFVAIGIFELAFSVDLFLVNQLGLPFYSGPCLLILLFVLTSGFILRKFNRVRSYMLSVVFLLLGFAPYLLLFIRSNHNPPIDEFNPENLAMIKAYMNRESYPASPLLYGPFFDARIIDVSVKKQIYYKDTSAYSFAGILPQYHYDSRKTILPRMYSNDPDHINTYRQWTGLKENEQPGFDDNLKFMFTYQLGHMYARYLMWNFAGRSGDIQNSRWLKPWERADAPFDTSRNQYWMIPLLLGIGGAVFQYRRDRKGFVSVVILFLITGLVLAGYLNSPPNEPRERDYIYVGSFIAFGVWIGMGLLSCAKYVSAVRGGLIAFFVVSVCVPLWMLYQNYSDHDRSNRTFQVDNARNILRSCAPNSIIFTGGDNDTFPLWYLQEVEGFRTDVRVMVLSYLNSDWYINQLRKSYYDSPAFKLTLGEDDYRQYGPNDVLYVHESVKGRIDVGQFFSLLKSEHPALRKISEDGEPYHILPSRLLSVTTAEPEASSDLRGMELDVEANYISKNLVAILDLIISNAWERPMYFNFTSLNSAGVDLTRYVIHEGPLYRLTPHRNHSDTLAVDTSLAYKNLVAEADYTNLADASVHFSYEDHFARMIVPIRQAFNDLAIALAREGNREMALDVLKQAVEKLYHAHLLPSYTNVEAAELLMTLGELTLANRLSKSAFDHYYGRITNDRHLGLPSSQLDRYLAGRSAELLAKLGKPEYLKQLTSLGD